MTTNVSNTVDDERDVFSRLRLALSFISSRPRNLVFPGLSFGLPQPLGKRQDEAWRPGRCLPSAQAAEDTGTRDFETQQERP